jgi:phage terminase large subunit
MNGGGKRAVAVWHRRAGKDSTSLHWTTVASLRRVGTYWHMLPTLAQARKVVWDGIAKDGKRVLDAWPGWRRPGSGIVSHLRNDEMKMELVNGSVWQCVGSDNYNSLVGANPVGVVFSEYSLADPAAWDFIRPILAENGGWALFIYTPRGKNHGYRLLEQAKDNPDWFSSVLTVDDTGAISPEIVESERRAGMSEELIQQEFYCSFEASLEGAYYAKQLRQAETDGRIGGVPHDSAVLVETWWDLGIGDATTIWFAQRVGQEIHLIDYYENSGESLAHYVGILQAKARDRGFNYGDHVLPHDAAARELGTGKSREEVLRSLGVKPVILPAQRVEDGIEATRGMLGKCWFDKTNTARGLEGLRAYRKEEDHKAGDGVRTYYKDRPVHDWASHPADAFRQGAMHKPISGSFNAPIDWSKHRLAIA